MATNYPDGLDSFVNPTGTDALSSPAHATQHANVNDAVEAIEATLGLNPEGTYTDVSDRLDALVTDAAAAASAYNDSAQAAMGSAISAAGSAQSYSVDSYSYSQFASTDADLASAAAGSAVASASAAAASASSAASSAATVDATATTATEFRQFAADGSVLSNLPARVHPAEQLLKQAVWWIDAAHSSASGQSVSNLGWGGSALDAQLGSSGSADSNDPKYLDWQGENYVYLPGVSGNYLSVPDEAALDITGDIDIRVKVALDDWTPAAVNRLLSKRSSAANGYSWRLDVNTAGTLRFAWSADGSVEVTADSTTATAVTDGAVKWIRAVLDVDDGGVYKVYFYTSDDGASWAQLGSTVTGVATTSIYASTAPVEVGASNDGTGSPASGRIHRAQVLNGINGTPVLDVDCSQISSGADTSFTALTGQTVTINRSTSGRKTVGVVHPRWLFGTDDYIRVANSPLWARINSGEALTVVAVIRQWGTPPASSYWIGSRNGTSAEGYGLPSPSGNTTPSLFVDDGPSLYYQTGPSLTYGQTTLLTGVIDLGATQEMYMYTNDSLGTVRSLSGVSVDSDGYLSVGSAGGFGYSDFEGVSFAIWRRALTAGEIATLNSYFQGRG